MWCSGLYYEFYLVVLEFNRSESVFQHSLLLHHLTLLLLEFVHDLFIMFLSFLYLFQLSSQ